VKKFLKALLAIPLLIQLCYLYEPVRDKLRKIGDSDPEVYAFVVLAEEIVSIFNDIAKKKLRKRRR